MDRTPTLKAFDDLRHVEAIYVEMFDALSQWRNAEDSGDAEELQNARISRDIALAIARKI